MGCKISCNQKILIFKNKNHLEHELRGEIKWKNKEKITKYYLTNRKYML